MEIKSLPPMDQLSTRLKVIDSSKHQRILALRDLFSSSSILSAMPVNQDGTPASKAAIQLCWWWWFVIRSSRYLYSLLQYIISSIPMNQSKSKYQGTGSTSFTWHNIYLAQRSLAMIVFNAAMPPEGWSHLHMQSSQSLKALSNSSYCICTNCYCLHKPPSKL